MEATELDVALEELETRLERLRALYEQYFMGIERVEPAIPRKDVDRRIYVLRREKIRNTAKRFKLQTIIQRYNTFQQYWQRICREIENGTYKRHVIRAERVAPDALLTIAARKRLGRNRNSSPPEANTGVEAAAGAASPSSPPSAPPGPRPASAPPPSARPAAPRTPTPKPALESLSLDMDFLGDWDPGARFQSARPKMPAANAPTSPELPPAAQAAPKPSAPEPPTKPALQPPPKPALKPPPKPVRPEAKAAAPPPKPEARPAKPEAPPPAKPVAAPKPTAAASPKTIADEQIRSLHARLVEAKKQTKESSSVSVEGLARSLEATAAKLREQHKNRKIEFDVVIKDGKAVVKPIVK